MIEQEIPAGSWVQIEKVLLTPEQRAPNIPEDTKGTPYVLNLSGFLENAARLGQEAKIRTLIGRHVRGKLKRVNPGYDHDFGETVRELLDIGLGGEA